MRTPEEYLFDGKSDMTEHEKNQEMIRQKEQAPIALDPRCTALVVVDVQRFFARQDPEFVQVFQRLAPGATDGYFQRVNSIVLPRIQELLCFRSLGLPIIFCVFGSDTRDGRDLPSCLKDFDELGLQLLGRSHCAWRLCQLLAGSKGFIQRISDPPRDEILTSSATRAVRSNLLPTARQHSEQLTSRLYR
jgi:nicotinamidase-related amidase